MKTLTLLLVLCSACMIACVKPAVQPDPAAETEFATDSLHAVEQIENLDPLMLPEEELVFRPDWSEEVAPEELEEEPGNASAFQVQLSASPDREDAEEVRLQAMMLFPGEAVEITWDSPNYKVRVGNEASQEAAEDLKRQALRLGYRDAWVVKKKAQ